jgi:hypothetical protein
MCTFTAAAHVASEAVARAPHGTPSTGSPAESKDTVTSAFECEANVEDALTAAKT